MAEAKYNTAQHKALKRRWAAEIQAGNGYCTEPTCLMPSRYIPPDTPSDQWHVPHNEDGITYRNGPAHAACNIAEGNVRRKKTQPRRLIL